MGGSADGLNPLSRVRTVGFDTANSEYEKVWSEVLKLYLLTHIYFREHGELRIKMRYTQEKGSSLRRLTKTPAANSHMKLPGSEPSFINVCLIICPVGRQLVGISNEWC